MPFKRDLSDLERQLKWAVANDERVMKNNKLIVSFLKA